MKIGLPDYSGLTHQTRTAFQTLEEQIRGGFLQQHTVTGGHTDITADSVSMGGFMFPTSAVITPPTITANVNTYTLPFLASAVIFKLSTDAARTIFGLTAPSDLTVYRRWLLRNVGDFDLTLAHRSLNTSGPNRIVCPGSVDVTLNSCDSVWIHYDPSPSSSATAGGKRWIVEGL